MLELLVVLLILGWATGGGLGGWGYPGFRGGSRWGDSGLIHVLLVIAVAVICLRVLGIPAL